MFEDSLRVSPRLSSPERVSQAPLCFQPVSALESPCLPWLLSPQTLPDEFPSPGALFSPCSRTWLALGSFGTFPKEEHTLFLLILPPPFFFS